MPLLRDLVRTPFFRYFKVNLYCDCPFWPDDGMCMLRDCGVCECEPDEVPTPWKAADTAAGCEGRLLHTCMQCRDKQISCRLCIIALHYLRMQREQAAMRGSTYSTLLYC